MSKKPFYKDNFNHDYEIMTYICPLGQPLYKKQIPIQKQNKNHTLDQRMQKLHSTRILQQNTTIQNNQWLRKHFQNKNAKKNGNPRSTKKSTKHAQKQQLPFANMKQNMHLTEFTTTGLKQVKHRI